MSRPAAIASSTKAGICLMVLAPMLAILSILVAVIFQRYPVVCRLGSSTEGHAIPIYQFRTSSDDPASGSWFGNFLQQNSLYRLPELMNVALGEISLETFGSG